MFQTYYRSAVEHVEENYRYNRHTSAVFKANNLYEQVSRKASLRRAINHLLGRKNTLLDLQSVLNKQETGDQQYRGGHAIPINKIIGSENRSSDFDQAFMPINRSSRHRWMNIAAIMLRGESLPAVELVQVGDNYFVRDGHHRVSVAKALGQIDIDALVTAWVPVCAAAQAAPCCRHSRFAPMVDLPF